MPNINLNTDLNMSQYKHERILKHMFKNLFKLIFKKIRNKHKFTHRNKTDR